MSKSEWRRKYSFIELIFVVESRGFETTWLSN